MHTYEEVRQAGRRRRRHSAEFKAEMVAACRQPGVSIASVALTHGLNANLLRRWIIEHEHATSPPPQVSKVADSTAPELVPTFVPVTVAPERGRDEQIRVELRRGAMIVTVAWPVSAASDCAAWIRELLR